MPQDWVGLWAQGADNSAYLSWVYDSSCTSQYVGAAKASGSCQYPLPANLTAGTYELRLFANGTWTRLAVSNTFTVTASTPNPTTLSASPTSATAGGTVTATFSNVANPMPQDWIGLWAQGADNSAYLSWVYDNSCTSQYVRRRKGLRLLRIHPAHQSIGRDLRTPPFRQRYLDAPGREQYLFGVLIARTGKPKLHERRGPPRRSWCFWYPLGVALMQRCMARAGPSLTYHHLVAQNCSFMLYAGGYSCRCNGQRSYAWHHAIWTTTREDRGVNACVPGGVSVGNPYPKQFENLADGACFDSNGTITATYSD